MKKILYRLICTLALAAALYLGLCEGLRAFFLYSCNKYTVRDHTFLYFSFLWVRPDLKVDLRQVSFTSDLGPNNWRAQRAVLDFNILDAVWQDVHFNSITIYNADFHFLMKILSPKSGEPFYPGKKHRWELREFDERTNVIIDELNVIDSRIKFYDDRQTRFEKQWDEKIELSDVRLYARNFAYPFRPKPLEYSVQAKLVQADRLGEISVDGSTFLGSLDTKAHVLIKNIDLPEVLPALDRDLAARIISGVMDLSSNIRIINRTLGFHYKIALTEFNINPETTLFNMPYKVISAMLKNTQSSMKVTIDVTGTLDSPEYKINNEFGHSVQYGVQRTVEGGLKTVIGLPVSILSIGAQGMSAIFSPIISTSSGKKSDDKEKEETPAAQEKSGFAAKPDELTPTPPAGQGSGEMV